MFQIKAIKYRRAYIAMFDLVITLKHPAKVMLEFLNGIFLIIFYGFIEIVFCNCLSFISTFQSNYKQIGFTINYMESIVFLIAYQRYLTGFDG